MKQTSELTVRSLGKKEVCLPPNERKTGYFYELVLPMQKQRTLHTILLIDGSLSMMDDLENLKDLVSETVSSLSHKHKLSVLLFGNEVGPLWILEQMQVMNQEQVIGQLHQALEEQCGEETCILSSALAEVFSMVACGKNSENRQLIIVTAGNLYSKHCSLSVERSRCYGWMLDLFAAHVITHVVGVGKIDLPFLTQLANVGQTGDFYPYCRAPYYRRRFRCWVSELKGQKKQHLTLLNQDYFLVNQTQHLKHPKKIESLSQLMVTFDGALHLNDEMIDGNESDIPDFIEEQFQLAYGYYLLKNRRVHEAGNWLQGNPLFPVIYEGYSITEMKNSLAQLADWRGSHSSLTLPMSDLSFFDVLKRLLEDPLTELYYPHEKTSEIHLSCDPLTFRSDLSKRYHPVVQVKASQTKLNVLAKVKVDGAVQKNQQPLKLNAFVYRTYFLVKEGELALKTLACRLSPKLRQELLTHGVRLKRCPSNERLDLLDLSLLKLTHFQRISPEVPLEVAKGLYELEYLAMKRHVLKNILQKEREKLGRERVAPTSLSREYRVNHLGLFLPKGVRKEKNEHPGYEGDMIKWRVENFNKRDVARQCYEEIYQKILSISTNPFDCLNLELTQVKNRQLTLFNQIHFLRIQATLCGQSIFCFEQQSEKKRQSLRFGTVSYLISTQKIGDIVICENKRTLLITC